MQHYHSLTDVSLHDSWLTIGVFDGIHRGHQAILQKLTAGARRAGVPAVVLTFWPHPATVLGHGDVRCLTTPDERANLLEEFGVDVVVTYPFDQTVANTSARDFVMTLKDHLDFGQLLIGYDFALGKGRAGNALSLTGIGKELGYKVDVIPAVSDESGVVSSTAIRKLVSVGSVAEASRLLGRYYSLHGPVVRGDQRGHSLGIPTANIEYPSEKVIPARGIYACWAFLGDEKRSAVVNIGINPTFTPDKKTTNVEAYLLDFDRDIYGEDLRLEFVERLRDELKFSTVEELLVQIQLDVEKGRQILSGK